MRVLFAPDSYKGTLTSVEVARALAAGWWRARPGDTLMHAPLGDGGEGTVYAIAVSGGWEWQQSGVTGPDFRQASARWLRSSDGQRAYIELAQASGLSLVDPARLEPVGATSEGTGELLRCAIDLGVRRITLGIGGSATTDGGAGLLRALGAQMNNDRTWIDLSRLDARLGETHLRIACDVTNPLLGPTGAAAVYGPQKGATPAQVIELDARLAAFADTLESATGRRERNTSGAGAAGGVGFGLLCLRDRFASLDMVPGIDLVAEETDLAVKLAGADLVITGEGRIDAQTAFGKTALGVARRAQAAGVRCIAVGGGVTAEGVAALAAVGAQAVPASDPPMPLEEAIAAGAAPLIACGERLARLERLT